MKIEDKLKERAGSHGNFTFVAATSQRFKEIARKGKSWSTMSDREKEAVDQMLHKITRIVEGDSSFPDHWHDILGYSTLGLQNG